MNRFAYGASLVVLALLGAVPATAGLLTMSVVSGVNPIEGGTPIEDPLGRETLSGTTLAQLGSPMLADPAGGMTLGLTVRITNTSDAAIVFPDLFAGVSVLTSISGIPGYASKSNTAAGGGAVSGGDGEDGVISRGVLDMSVPLEVAGSPHSGQHGGGGGAGTGVADNWISVAGASGADLAAYLAGVTLEPGAFIDIPDFIMIAAFGRSSADARIAFAFDFQTFSSGGRSVTTGAWSGAFTGPGPVEPPPASVPEPTAWLTALTGLIAGGGLRRAGRNRLEDRPREAR
jgi:hypothetical protein